MAIVRNKINKIWPHIPKNEHTIIIGSRQIGKSTILQEIASVLQKKGEIAVLLNLERGEILKDLDENPENIFKYVFLKENKMSYVLIDEIQYLKNPTNFLKLLYDEYKGKLKIIATGSSAFYIDRDFKDSLAGRKKIIRLKTLSFSEYIDFRNDDLLCSTYDKLKKRPNLKLANKQILWAAFEDYITYGGYPAVVLANTIEDKKEILTELKDSYIKRDILESGIKDEAKFYQLFKILASQTGSMLNINELGNTLKLNNATVDEYIYILRKCFHISLVRPFYNNVRKELVKMPKVYVNDLGLRNAFLNYYEPISHRPDKGAMLENVVFNLLNEHYHEDMIKYWRTADGNEVDFVIDESIITGGKAIEVKYSETENRLSKYKKFIEAYPKYPFSFMNWGDDYLFDLNNPDDE